MKEMFNEKLEKMKIYKNYREESAMRISYWLFGEEAVRYMEDYSEEKTAKELAKHIVHHTDYSIYMFNPKSDDASELLFQAWGWADYMEVDLLFYQRLLIVNTFKAEKEVSHE